MNKKKITLAIVLLIICGGIVTYSIIQRNEKIHTQELAQQKLEAQLKKEKETLKTAETAVEIAYQSRETKDIELANQAIEKLNDNQNKEKKMLTTRMIELNSFIKQIDELKTALTKAEKSKTDTDIKTVQKLLDNMTNDYLKEDKETAIKNLDKLKASIKEEQAKVEADKKAVAESSAQQQVENETQLQGEQETSNQQSYNEAPQQNYQEPIQQAPAQQAPSGGGASQNTAAQQAAQNAQNNTNNNNGIMGNEAPNGGQMETPGWGF